MGRWLLGRASHRPNLPMSPPGRGGFSEGNGTDREELCKRDDALRILILYYVPSALVLILERFWFSGILCCFSLVVCHVVSYPVFFWRVTEEYLRTSRMPTHGSSGHNKPLGILRRTRELGSRLHWCWTEEESDGCTCINIDSWSPGLKSPKVSFMIEISMTCQGPGKMNWCHLFKLYQKFIFQTVNEKDIGLECGSRLLQFPVVILHGNINCYSIVCNCTQLGVQFDSSTKS